MSNFVRFLFTSPSGNKVTLETLPKEKGIDPREELLKFHKQYYSANLMGLSVLGKGKFESKICIQSCFE